MERFAGVWAEEEVTGFQAVEGGLFDGGELDFEGGLFEAEFLELGGDFLG